MVLHAELAAIDYKHFDKYTKLADNVMAVIAFSTSKTLTAYGARVGAAICITKNKEELQKFINAGIYSARSIWSTVNNSVMELFTLITTDQKYLNPYMKEKAFYVNLLKERSTIFVSEANQVGLDIYPYKEGFFGTLMSLYSKKEK